MSSSGTLAYSGGLFGGALLFGELIQVSLFGKLIRVRSLIRGAYLELFGPIRGVIRAESWSFGAYLFSGVHSGVDCLSGRQAGGA